MDIGDKPLAPSDLAALWDKALSSYKETTKIDLRTREERHMGMQTILDFQEKELQAFANFRHDGRKVDQLRSLIAGNADRIEKVVEGVSNAASSTFPPAIAIATTINIVLRASNKVSGDYDMVESFFDVMHSFLSRLCLLEGNLPEKPAYQVALMNVFSGLLALSGIAHKYCTDKHGRLAKWAKALVSGSDAKLKETYDQLHENLKRLESATMMVTLNAVLETQKVDRDTNTLVHEGVDVNRQILRSLGGIRALLHGDDARGGGTTNRHGDLGARNSTALAVVKEILSTPAHAKTVARRNQLKRSFTPKTCQWAEAEVGYADIVNGIEKVLHITGGPGMGKSSLCFAMHNRLAKRFQTEAEASVVYFHFDGADDDLNFCTAMIWSCTIQAATQDVRYRVQICADLQQNGFMDESARSLVDKRDGMYWSKFFTSKFAHDSQRRLVLILDAVDQLPPGELGKLMDYVRDSVRQQAAIQFILVRCGREDVLSLDDLEVSHIDIKREKILRDIRAVARARVNSPVMARLQGLSKEVRRKIIKELSAHADSFLYVEHMLRRLNSIGRDHQIKKLLRTLPENTQTLYSLLISECEKNGAYSEILRTLCTWVAYSKEPLSLGSAHRLVEVITGEQSVGLVDELSGSLSGLLRLTSNESGGDESESSEDDSASIGSDESWEGTDEGQEQEQEYEANSCLEFHEPNLRRFFQTAPLTRQSSPQVTMFSLVVKILTDSSFQNERALFYYESRRSTAESRLVRYAARHWRQHLLDIEVEESSTTDDQARIVMAGIYAIMTNKDDALKKIENENETSSSNSVFGSTPTDREATLEAILKWANRAAKLFSSGTVQGDDISGWLNLIVDRPGRIYLQAARCHILNLFTVDTLPDAAACFPFAHQALIDAYEKGTPELFKAPSQPNGQGHHKPPNTATASPPDSVLAGGKKASASASAAISDPVLSLVSQNVELHAYLQGFDPDTAADDEIITERSVLVTANAFPDIPITSLRKRKIALALKAFGLMQPALDMAVEALKYASTPRERFELNCTVASTIFAMVEQDTRAPAPGEGTDPNEDRAPLPKPEGEHKEKLQRIMDAAEAALCFCPKYSSEPDRDANLRALVSELHLIQAIVHTCFQRYTEAVSSVLQASKVPHTYMPFLGLVVDALGAAGQWGSIMAVVNAIPPSDEAVCYEVVYSSRTSRTNIYIQRAAAMTCQGAALLRLYRDMAHFLDACPGLGGNVARLRAAEFSAAVLGDRQRATGLLDAALGADMARGGFVVLVYYFRAELLLEEFRLGTDPLVKQAALGRMRNLVALLKELENGEFQPDVSMMAIPLALMLRQWGPAGEFQAVVDAAFQGCLRTLRDDIATNDTDSFRMLSKVLSLIPGLEFEAQVAATCQFYAMDDEVYNAYVAVISTDKSSAESETSPREKAAKADDDATAEAHDRMKFAFPEYIYCSSCGKVFGSFEDGPLYLCYYCTTTDLCAACYAARERGSWLMVCPAGHKHIKAPVNGWEGVKSGVFYVDGRAFVFRDWLAELERDKWKAAWERFWAF